MVDHPYLDPPSLRKAFRALDARIDEPVTLIVGDGTAMMLAYGLPVRTRDVDAYTATSHLDDLAPAVREVAREMGFSSDWMNPYFETYTHVLPSDYGSRLKEVFAGERLRVMALGLEDLLIMKCFAGREKDIGHARALLKKGPDLALVDGRIHQLIEKGIQGAREAGDFFDDLGGGA
jgi:predicted nucleotidyltransferase